MFTFIDLFAGIGGFRLALERVGGKCVFSSEWNKFSCMTYKANFGEVPHGDIRKKETKDKIPEGFDVLTGGFPCQPFSYAGKRLGEKDERGNLFYEIREILERRRPKAFILENVKGLLSIDDGRYFTEYVMSLCSLGYNVSFDVIDAQHFVPQHRERVFIVGIRGKKFDWDDVSLPQKGVIKLKSILHPEDGSEKVEEPYTEGMLATVKKKYIMSDRMWSGTLKHHEKRHPEAKRFYWLTNGDGVSKTLLARYYKDGSNILIDRGEGNCPRRLTPRECARIMGFPDSFRIPVSDTQAYQQFGNSIVVPVVEEIARVLMNYLR